VRDERDGTHIGVADKARDFLIKARETDRIQVREHGRWQESRLKNKSDKRGDALSRAQDERPHEYLSVA
jgi:hypothetical protein